MAMPSNAKRRYTSGTALPRANVASEMSQVATEISMNDQHRGWPADSTGDTCLRQRLAGAHYDGRPAFGVWVERGREGLRPCGVPSRRSYHRHGGHPACWAVPTRIQRPSEDDEEPASSGSTVKEWLPQIGDAAAAARRLASPDLLLGLPPRPPSTRWAS
jgi:hypothetical protein